VIGGSKIGFLVEREVENRRFLVCTDDASLKRSYPSLKRATIVVAQIEIYPFAQACR